MSLLDLPPHSLRDLPQLLREEAEEEARLDTDPDAYDPERHNLVTSHIEELLYANREAISRIIWFARQVGDELKQPRGGEDG